MADQSAGESLEESPDTTVVVSRSVSQSITDVWKRLVTPEGAEALLGVGGVLGDKGDNWRAVDGTFGVVRSYHPLEQIRFSWHATEDAPKTLVDLHLQDHGDSQTLLEIRHENIPDGLDADQLVRHWEVALDRIAAHAE